MTKVPMRACGRWRARARKNVTAFDADRLYVGQQATVRALGIGHVLLEENLRGAFSYITAAFALATRIDPATR